MMKKRMMSVLLVVAMVFTLAGCTEADRVCHILQTRMETPPSDTGH